MFVSKHKYDFSNLRFKQSFQASSFFTYSKMSIYHISNRRKNVIKDLRKRLHALISFSQHLEKSLNIAKKKLMDEQTSYKSLLQLYNETNNMLNKKREIHKKVVSSSRNERRRMKKQNTNLSSQMSRLTVDYEMMKFFTILFIMFSLSMIF